MMGIFTILACHKLHYFKIAKLFKKTFFSKEKICDENENFKNLNKNEIFKINLLFGRDVPKPPRYYNIVSKTNLLLVI